MNCTILGCPGKYVDETIVHPVRYHGELIVINNVPAEVCSICGDVLLKPQTVIGIEELLRNRREPTGSAPVYEYAQSENAEEVRALESQESDTIVSKDM